MPVREEMGRKKLVADERAHDHVEPKLLSLALEGSKYLRFKKEEKTLKGHIDKLNKTIKASFDDESLYVMNGTHKEIYAPLGDGVNEIFIQMQGRQSVKTVPNIIELIRAKLGKPAESYIMKVEVLHDTALQSMLNSGLITNQDILDWTTNSTTYALNVSANKKKS